MNRDVGLQFERLFPSPTQEKSMGQEDRFTFPRVDLANGWHVGIEPLVIVPSRLGFELRQCLAMYFYTPNDQRVFFRIAESPMRHVALGKQDELGNLQRLSATIQSLRRSGDIEMEKPFHLPLPLSDMQTVLPDAFDTRTLHTEKPYSDGYGYFLSGIPGQRLKQMFTLLQGWKKSIVYSRSEKKVLAAYFMLQASSDIEEVHDLGMYHNHPHTENFHVNGSGIVHLLDFGIISRRDSQDLQDENEYDSFFDHRENAFIPLLRSLGVSVKEFERARQRNYRISQEHIHEAFAHITRFLTRKGYTVGQVRETLLGNERLERFMIEQTLVSHGFKNLRPEDIEAFYIATKQAIVQSPTIAIPEK